MDAGGSVAFLFTDVVGSTRLWAEEPEAMAADLAEHDELVVQAVTASAGHVFATGGDSFAAAFPTVEQAAAAAVKVQQGLHEHVWRVPGGISVRAAVHVGAPVVRGDDYFGPPLNEAARIMAAAHGGQVLVSEAAARALEPLALVDLGEHRLRDLDGSHRLYQLDVPGLPSSHPLPRSLDRQVTTLPAQRSSFVGRTAEVVKVRRLLAANRLVTLTGVGGVGKTRLAVEAAGREIDEFPDGVYFVDLADAATDGDVPAAVLKGIELVVPPDMQPVDRVIEFLAPRSTLLVLDNCEHVLDAVADVVDRVLAAAPGVRVLATSREAVDLDGEVTMPVPSLDTFDERSAGVRLFLERAHAVNASFDPGRESRAAVVQLCERLDGIPLAIELAAARVRSMTPAEILSRLDDRFRLLTGGRRRRAKRQQTLEATIDWSYELLDGSEQHFLRCVGTLTGGWLVGTAAAVAGVDEASAVDLVDSLVAKSLVVAVPLVEGLTGYQLLETVREYALRRATDAGEIDAARERLVESVGAVDLYMQETFADLTAAGFEFANRLLAAEEALERGRWPEAVTALAHSGPAATPADAQRLLALAATLRERAARDLDGLTQLRLLLFVATRQMVNGDFVQSAQAARRAVEDFGGADATFASACQGVRLIYDAHVSPSAALEGVDRAVAVALESDHPDHSMPILLSARATALGMCRRHTEAYAAAREAVAWCQPGHALVETGLQIVAWAARLAGVPVDDDVAERLAGYPPRHGWLGHTVRIAAVMQANPIRESLGRALAAVAEEELTGRVPWAESDFLVVLGRLALEEGDLDRARRLLVPVVPRGMGGNVAAIDTLARIEGWPDDSFEQHRLAAMLAMSDPGHRARAREDGPRVLAEELERWR